MIKKIVTFSLITFLLTSSHSASLTKKKNLDYQKSFLEKHKIGLNAAVGGTLGGNKPRSSDVDFKQKNNLVVNFGLTKGLTSDLAIQMRFIAAVNSKAEQSYSKHVTNYRDTAKYSSYSLLGGLKYKLLKQNKLSIFLQGGLGSARNSLKVDSVYINNSYNSTYYKKTKSSFAYSLGVQGEYEIRSKAFLTLGYDYIDFGKFNTKPLAFAGGAVVSVSPYKFKVRSHALTLGLNYLF